MDQVQAKIAIALKSSRPISWINTAFPFAATYLFINKEVDPYFIIGTLYFLIPFNLLMYGINDVFDYESDKNNPRKDSVEGAVLGKKYHRTIINFVLVSNVPFLLWLGINSNTEALFALIFVVGTALAYSVPGLRYKEIPFIDSMTSSSHFVGPMLVALAQLGATGSALMLLIAYFLWGMASHAFGAVQDVIPDRKAGIGSIATVIGAKETVRFSLVLYLASTVILYTFSSATYAVATVSLIYPLNIIGFAGISDKNSEKANAGWKRFIYLNWIAGFVITITLILNF